MGINEIYLNIIVNNLRKRKIDTYSSWDDVERGVGEGWVGERKRIRDPTEIEYLNMKYTLSQIAQWVMI